MAKILIIDDAKFSRFMVVSLVKALGHEILEAENGQTGLEKVTTEHPDIIITDLLMPEMDGVELLETLKQRNIATPVIVLSSNIQQTMQQKCMELGAAAFITKPLNKEKLHECINTMLSGDRQA